MTPRRSPTWQGVAGLLTLAALCLGATRAAAQTSALAWSGTPPRVRYLSNESGGSIALQSLAPDSAAVEAVRLELLEAAAAIRRGDLRLVRLVRSDTPAARVMVTHRQLIRCTYRNLARGGELVLLSDDAQVVAAIHAVLTKEPAALER